MSREHQMMKNNSSHDNGRRGGVGDLLVDFPHMMKNRNISSTTTSSGNNIPIRWASSISTPTREEEVKPSSSVHFKKQGSMKLVKPLSRDDKRSMCYSHDEYDIFKRKFVRDACNVSRKILLGEYKDDDKIRSVVGLEKVLAGRMIKERQVKHVRTILCEQELQDMRGVTDVEALSRLSYSSSEWSRRRAHNLAVAYAALGGQ